LWARRYGKLRGCRRSVETQREKRAQQWREDSTQARRAARASLDDAAVLPAQRVQQLCTGRLQRNSFAVAFNADGSAQNEFGWSVVLLAGVAAGDNSVCGGVNANHAMEQNAVAAEGERDISAPEILRTDRLGDYRVAAQDVGLHALPVREETHLRAALEGGLAEHRELRRITPQ
jgi:hypothetical protein